MRIIFPPLSRTGVVLSRPFSPIIPQRAYNPDASSSRTPRDTRQSGSLTAPMYANSTEGACLLNALASDFASASKDRPPEEGADPPKRERRVVFVVSAVSSLARALASTSPNGSVDVTHPGKELATISLCFRPRFGRGDLRADIKRQRMRARCGRLVATRSRRLRTRADAMLMI